jgi:hypothetical protein
VGELQRGWYKLDYGSRNGGVVVVNTKVRMQFILFNIDSRLLLSVNGGVEVHGISCALAHVQIRDDGIQIAIII